MLLEFKYLFLKLSGTVPKKNPRDTYHILKLCSRLLPRGAAFLAAPSGPPPSATRPSGPTRRWMAVPSAAPSDLPHMRGGRIGDGCSRWNSRPPQCLSGRPSGAQRPTRKATESVDEEDGKYPWDFYCFFLGDSSILKKIRSFLSISYFPVCVCVCVYT